MGGVQYAPRWLYSAQKDLRGALHYQSELSRSDQPWNYPTANIPSFQLRPQFSSETWALIISVLDQDTLEHSRRCTNGSAHLRMKQSAWRTCALRYRLKSALESSAGGGGGGTASSMNLSRNAKLLSLRQALWRPPSAPDRAPGCPASSGQPRPISRLSRAGRLRYIGLGFRPRIAP